MDKFILMKTILQNQNEWKIIITFENLENWKELFLLTTSLWYVSPVSFIGNYENETWNCCNCFIMFSVCDSNHLKSNILWNISLRTQMQLFQWAKKLKNLKWMVLYILWVGCFYLCALQGHLLRASGLNDTGGSIFTFCTAIHHFPNRHKSNK